MSFKIILATNENMEQIQIHMAFLRASIITDCKQAKCWGGGEKRGERGEAGCKLIAGFDTVTKKPYDRDRWVIY